MTEPNRIACQDTLDRMGMKMADGLAMDIKCRRCSAFYSSAETISCPQCGRYYCQGCNDDESGWVTFIVEQVPLGNGEFRDGQKDPAAPGEKPTPGKTRKVAVKCNMCADEIRQRAFDKAGKGER